MRIHTLQLVFRVNTVGLNGRHGLQNILDGSTYKNVPVFN